MNVNTSVITVSELLKDDNIYAVPIFQRSFAWEREEIADFWADLKYVYENRRENAGYFIGSMVFAPHEEGKMKILDGQQRFATFLLFLAALRDEIKENEIENKEDRIEAINGIICPLDEVELSRNVKLELNREDMNYFEDAVVQGVFAEPKYESHKLIKNAYEFFRAEIGKTLNTSGDAWVEKVLGTLLRDFLLIRIEVDSDENAHVIFETLNDRGLELSVADLVKNYIFSISGKNLEKNVRKWKDIIDLVGDHNVTRFLRHYWISSYGIARKDDLYKKIKTEVKLKNVTAFLNRLSEEANVYANLTNPTHEFWNDNEIEELLTNLSYLRGEQVYSLLLAVYTKHKSKKSAFKRILDQLVNLTFRYSTICGLNANELERAYSSIALKIRKGSLTFSGITKSIKKLNPPKPTFLSSFSNFETKNSKLARYILVTINNYLLKQAKGEEITTNIRKVNLEHIIPKKPDEEWKEFLRKKDMDKTDFVHKIGNMTILLDEYNKTASNTYFSFS